MNSNRLLKIGGGLNLFFAFFHLSFWKVFDWPATLAGISADNRAILYVLNLHTAVLLIIFAAVSIILTRELLDTKVGRVIVFFMGFFYVQRAVEEFVFFGSSGRNVVFFLVLLGVGLLYLVPFYRALREKTAAL